MFYFKDVSNGWVAGQPGDGIGFSVSSYRATQTAYKLVSYYDTARYDYVLNPGDQLTVGINGYSVLAYVDGFTDGTERISSWPTQSDTPRAWT